MVSKADNNELNFSFESKIDNADLNLLIQKKSEEIEQYLNTLKEMSTNLDIADRVNS